MPAALRPFLFLLLLATVWSGSFTLIKVAVETIPPFTATALRLLLPALLFFALLRWRGERLPRGWSHWSMLIAVGFVGNSVPFILINWGETVVDSGLAAILMGTSPLFTMLLAHHLTQDEHLSLGKVMGIAVGIAGVVLLMGVEVVGGIGRDLLAQLAIVGAALSYAISNMIVRRVKGLSLTAMTASVMLTGGVVTTPFALVLEQPWRLDPSFESLAALLAIGLVCTAGGNFIYFHVIRIAGPTFVSLTNYLIPVLGVIWGVIFLAEKPTWQALGALGLILSGVGVVNLALRRERARAAVKQAAPVSP